MDSLNLLRDSLPFHAHDGRAGPVEQDMRKTEARLGLCCCQIKGRWPEYQLQGRRPHPRSVRKLLVARLLQAQLESRSRGCPPEVR